MGRRSVGLWWRIGVFTAVVSSLAFGSVFGDKLLRSHYEDIQSRQILAMTQQTETVTSISASVRRDFTIPVRVSIPALGVNAPVLPVGLDSAGRMATIADPKTIAWYAYGPVPGATGNAILAGHRDWNGVLGSFWALERLRVHDVVVVDLSNGKEVRFIVTSTRTYLSTQVPNEVMDISSPTGLTLITCAGDFVRERGGYQSRVVIRLAKLSP